MILSFNPIFEADRQIICAGRDPDEKDLAAVRNAAAVVLPQGCRETLYRMARENCPRVFPNYDARFSYPGKLKQIILFHQFGAPCPDTRLFEAIDAFPNPDDPQFLKALPPFPFVFKFDWGGEGDYVHLIETPDQLMHVLDLAGKYEQSGQRGFLVQAYIPGSDRDLRVVVIHETLISYWRKHSGKGFPGNLSKGGEIDRDAFGDLQKTGRTAVRNLCEKTGINLAGFDIIFTMDEKTPRPLFLEINYFFGRKGLGGSAAYYALLTREIDRWVNTATAAGVRGAARRDGVE